MFTLNPINEKVHYRGNKSVVYNMYLYLPDNLKENNIGIFGEIVESINLNLLWRNEDRERVLRLKNACFNDQYIYNSVLGNVYKVENGMEACTFTEPDGSVYVVFKGTGNDDWIDNGEALSGYAQSNTYYSYNSKGDVIGKNNIIEYASNTQANALNYFNKITAMSGWTDKNIIILTGHSKGGNNAQFISINSGSVDECYNIDGQGFSLEAINMFKERFSDDYENRVKRIYSFSATNDYVNILGNSLTSSNNIFYFDCPVCDVSQLFNHYDYSILKEDGKLTEQCEQGELSKYLKNVSDEVMNLKPEIRSFITIGIMNIFQKLMGGKDYPDIDSKYTLKSIFMLSAYMLSEMFNYPESLEAVSSGNIESWLLKVFNKIGLEQCELNKTAAVASTLIPVIYLCPVLLEEKDNSLINTLGRLSDTLNDIDDENAYILAMVFKKLINTLRLRYYTEFDTSRIYH